MEIVDYYINAGSACIHLGEPTLSLKEIAFYASQLADSTTSFISSTYSSVNNWARGSIFWYQIILSTISAYIFYLFFTTLPYVRKKAKIQPLMDYELFMLRMTLSRFFDIIMSGRPSHPLVNHQELIIGGKLTEEKISISLQNKCLNKSAHIDRFHQTKLEPIGLELSYTIADAETLINKATGYDQFILPDEMILLEQIRQKMNEPILNRDVSGDIVKNCAYLSRQFFDLYLLFCELQELAFSRNQNTREWYIFKASYLFQSAQYKASIKFGKIAKKRYPQISRTFNMYSLMSQYKTSPGIKFYSHLKKSIKNSDLYEPTYSTLLLKLVKDDQKAVEIFRTGYGEQKINEALRMIADGSQQAADLETSNTELKVLFDQIELGHLLASARSDVR